MGLLDELASGVPGGDVSKPVMIALAALVGSKLLGGGLRNIFGGAPGTTAPSTGSATAPGQPEASGGLVGGLGGLLERFQQNGFGGHINSWIAPGPNQPISPQQVHQAIGPDIIDSLVQKTGLPRDQLLAELSRVLPALVDKATPQGRLPTDAELGAS